MTARQLTLLLLAAVPASATLGSGLWRDYGVYAGMPTNTTAAAADGWFQVSSDCDADLGIMWAQTADGPTESKPIVLYFTPAGQVAGVGTRATGDFAGAVVDQGFWQQLEDEVFFISVTFRSADAVCADTLSPDTLGDRAVINANSIGISVPLQQADATAAGYEVGSCFASMGTHSFIDVVGDNGTMTWSSMNLQPVVPMYDRDADWALNAIFFTTPFVQQGFFATNQWEPVPLANVLMCKNWCDDDCGWDDTSFWSTMHIYFSDPHEVVCQDGCSIGCCE